MDRHRGVASAPPRWTSRDEPRKAARDGVAPPVDPRALALVVALVAAAGAGAWMARGGAWGGLTLAVGSSVWLLAVAVGLRSVAAMRGIEAAGALALAKLQHVLPDRLWRRVQTLHESTDVGPAETATNVEAPPVDVGVLADLAAAIRDHEGLRLFYRPGGDVAAEERVEADPYRLVSWQQRWYVVVRRRPDRRWHALRVDWLELRTPGAGRFVVDPLEGGDYAAFVLRDVAFSGWNVHCRIAVDAPAEEVLRRINPTAGVVETVDGDHCVLVTGADSIEMVAVWIGLLGLDFHADEPPELVAHLRTLATRYAAAVPAAP